MTGPYLTHIVGPAAWAPYLLNGDASGLEPGEREKADAWLKREGVAIVGTEPDAEPYFSRAGATLVPELGASGFMALDYRAREVRLEASETERAAVDSRLAALRLRGCYVYPNGSPTFPRWTAVRLAGASWARLLGDADSELGAVEIAEREAGQ